MKNGRLAGEDFSRMYDPLKVEIANVEDRLALALGDELDVDTALSYLESCFWNASSLWQAEDTDGKQRFQKLIFPAGVAWDRENGDFGTPQTHSIFTLFAGFGNVTPDDAALVAPQGFEPRLIGSEPTVLPLN